MLTSEENILLTRTGPGTPMGDLIRRYWIPVLLSDELPGPDCAPKRVKILGEKLVAFRDSRGQAGLVDERCPHRNASLFFGRNEEGGLRCVYHGWKFDTSGRCVDMPSEPPESNFKNRIRVTAYPCVERGGAVWAYMGPPGQQPEFPEMEWTQVAASHRYVTRHLQECNWFQAFEGGFDNSHVPFLHRGSSDRPVPGGRHVGFEAVPADFGFIVGGARRVSETEVFWTASMMLMPFHKLISRVPADAVIGGHSWVPVDDGNCMNWCFEYHPDRPLSVKDLQRSKAYESIHAELVPGGERCVLNRDNDYGINRKSQASGKSATGMKGVGIQDCAVQESMGTVSDRTREHLGTSDRAIIQVRKFMLGALQEVKDGLPPPGLNAASYKVRPTGFAIESKREYSRAVWEFIGTDSPPEMAG